MTTKENKKGAVSALFLAVAQPAKIKIKKAKNA